MKLCGSIFPGIPFINSMGQKILAGSLISVHYSPQLTFLTETGWFLKAKVYFILVKASIQKGFYLAKLLVFTPILG